MTIQPSRWRPNSRLSFVLAVVLLNGALALWFLCPSADISSHAPEQQEAAKPVNREPILLKKKVQENLNQESVEQTIERLPNFDDTVPNIEAAMGNARMGQNQYLFAIRYYPTLNRVRKILEEGRSDSSRVIPPLKDKLKHALDDYQQIENDYWQRIHARHSLVRSEWYEFEKRRISISCSVYLLAELAAFDALPLMTEIFIGQSNPDLDTVVNRVFLFCAMHHLVRSHPRDNLSPLAVKRLDEYLAAGKEIPVFEELLVPSWRSKYDAWDYRIAILGQDLEMDKQPHIRIHRYPEEMGNHEEAFTAVLKPPVRKWFAKMKLFIDEAYPADAKPTPKTKGGAS